jgi:hypothetical protein
VYVDLIIDGIIGYKGNPRGIYKNDDRMGESAAYSDLIS